VRRGATFDAARDAALTGVAERDRRLAHALAAGVLRHQRPLDAQLDLRRADPRLHDLLRLGAFQLRYLDRVPAYAAVATSVSLAAERAGDDAARFANHVLRRIAGSRHPAPGSRPPTHAPWLLARWRAQFGEDDAARLVAWNDTPPPLTLQPARWDLATLRARLREAAIATEDASFGVGIRLARGASGSPRPAPGSLPGYIEGGFVVQDPAAALVCRFAGVPRGAQVYDACAAPGGKSVTLAALGGSVIAGDHRRDRLPRLVETARRAGRAIAIVVADLTTAPFARGQFDAVVVDAPCTATGTIARHPEARVRITARAIAALAARQRSLLDAAAALVRPGGVLVYATCSLEPEENALQVDAFLERHPAFARAPVPGAVPATLVTAAGDLLALPPRHATDGAYAARLERRA
jgi:16S rRNA (cytosine967-C5)-methyltransferase